MILPFIHLSSHSSIHPFTIHPSIHSPFIHPSIHHSPIHPFTIYPSIHSPPSTQHPSNFLPPFTQHPSIHAVTTIHPSIHSSTTIYPFIHPSMHPLSPPSDGNTPAPDGPYPPLGTFHRFLSSLQTFSPSCSAVERGVKRRSYDEFERVGRS